MKRLLSVTAAALLTLLAFSAHAIPPQANIPRVILSGATAIGAGPPVGLLAGPFNGYSVDSQYMHACDAVLTGTTPTASVNLEVTNDPSTGWIVAATFTLSAGTPKQGQVLNAPWIFVRGNVTAISGTGATVVMTCAP